MGIRSEISVLVVDDSKLMRALLSDIFNEDPNINVVGTAEDGLDAVRKVHELKPDVITLDLKMPDYDGLYALEHIMRERPTPVIMVSAYTQVGAKETLNALNAGAFDFFAKSKGAMAAQMQKKSRELTAKVKVAARVDIKTLLSRPAETPTPAEVYLPEAAPVTGPYKVVAIGASTGGPPAIERILTSLDSDFSAPILVAQHMPKIFTASFAERLDDLTSLSVREAQEGDKIRPGEVLVCPGNSNMVVHPILRKTKSPLPFESPEAAGRVTFKKKNLPGDMRPSVNMLMTSVAKLYGAAAVGIVLTGMGIDGAAGLGAIKASGGLTIAQNKRSSVVYGMPRAAVENNAAAKVLAPDNIANLLNIVVPKKVETN